MRTLAKPSLDRKAWDALLSLVYPSRCSLCGELGDAAICPFCLEEVISTRSVDRPDDPSSPIDYFASLYLYRGRAAEAVRRLKYERATALARPLADLIAAAAVELGLLSADLVVPVPIHWTRRFARGFNQAELLCEGFDPSIVDPLALRRIRATAPQVGLSPERRAQNLAGAFRATAAVAGKAVLLVDDVSTSGHTATETALAARAAGATHISVLTLCGVR